MKKKWLEKISTYDKKVLQLHIIVNGKTRVLFFIRSAYVIITLNKNYRVKKVKYSTFLTDYARSGDYVYINESDCTAD